MKNVLGIIINNPSKQLGVLTALSRYRSLRVTDSSTLL